jgi:potassium channel subfamily K, other eukaryote
MMSLTFLNGLFFTVVTTLTIGFGDIVPKTSAQRIVVCLYAVFGIIILGAGVRLTTEAIIEGLEVGYRIRLREYRRQRRERKDEREQVRRWRATVEERLVERGLDVWTADKPTIGPSSALPNTRPTLSRRGTFGVQAMYLNTEALPPDVLESAAQEAGVPAEKFIGRKFGRRARQKHHHRSQQQQGNESQPSGSGRVPLDFTWSLDDWTHVELQQQRASWIGTLWERIRQALRLRAQPAPSEELTYQDMMKVLKRDERRSLYMKVRHLFLCNHTYGY